MGVIQELLEENVRNSWEGPFTNLSNESRSIPPCENYLCIDTFLEVVTKELKDLSGTKTLRNPLGVKSTYIIGTERFHCYKTLGQGGKCSHSRHSRLLWYVKNTNCYEILRSNPAAIYYRELKTLVDWALANKIISKKDHEFLLPNNPSISTSYGLPKVHKGINTLKGRPIVLGIDNLT